MKKLIWFVIPLLMTIYACDNGGGGAGGSTASLPMDSLADSVSYAIGVQMGNNFKQSQVQYGTENFKSDMMQNGIAEAVNGSARIDETAIRGLMMKFQTILMEKEGGENREAGKKFLMENASKEGVKTTASGLQYIVKEEGSGASPTTADKVEVHYEGRLLNDEVFDSSIARGKPTQFGVTQVIPGWTEGLQLMKEGAKYTFFIPSDLAYGPRGSGQKIGPDATLIFDVELIKVNP